MSEAHRATQTQIPVKFYIKTVVYHPESKEPENFELILFGHYQHTANATYLRYQEVMDVGTVNTTIKLSHNDDEMVILRNGAMKMRMVFRPNKQVSGAYHTENGYMEIVTEAKSFAYQHNDQTNEGTINLTYDLSMQEILAGTYNLEIKYKEERK
ncbi:DUF1934 domain-containing protein [Bacillus sp. DNRA2]|uniref:DUF1934 domain-containing protein n=1 Tax=Bacillus sp. DNRA2 TaxID=2723053 RepID=UPI00145D5F9B|nr:DUF1934 domain-containing protein [Bacillus sp. DNRA2]NMD70023.1 DUF1934 domain-containing protein [Bacillus sp. DNRA2]